MPTDTKKPARGDWSEASKRLAKASVSGVIGGGAMRKADRDVEDKHPEQGFAAPVILARTSGSKNYSSLSVPVRPGYKEFGSMFGLSQYPKGGDFANPAVEIAKTLSSGAKRGHLTHDEAQAIGDSLQDARYWAGSGGESDTMTRPSDRSVLRKSAKAALPKIEEMAKRAGAMPVRKE